MKILMFAACILAAITVSDAQFVVDIKTLMSKIFDIRELIHFHIMFAECIMKLGFSKIAQPELTFCIAQKKELIDKEGGILWDKTLSYLQKLVRDSNEIDLNNILKACKEEGDKFEGNKYEKTLKIMECGIPVIRSIMRSIIF